MWLPVQGLISPDTYFLESTPYITVTAPGDSTRGITATAYQYLDNSLYFQAGRGFTPNNQVTPDLAAPGVDVLGPANTSVHSGILKNTQTFTHRTGTSAAAAITAGAVANLLNWGIVMGNYPTMSEASIKSYLIRGASRNPSLSYPNREFGYGTLDLLQTFLKLRE